MCVTGMEAVTAVARTQACPAGEIAEFSFLLAIPVMAGAFIGTRLGIRTLSTAGVKRAVGAVLVIAGLKLFLHL